MNMPPLISGSDFHHFGAISDEFNKVPWFHFDVEAKKIFEDWLVTIEAKADDRNEEPALHEHFSKFPSLLCSLAVIFHLIELADEGKKETYIPARHIKMAIAWCDYLESHARRIYALAKTPSLSSAMCLADKLTDSTVKTPLANGFTAYDVLRREWTGVNSYPLVNAALARLEECHWIRGAENVPAKLGGRPTMRYEINPEILGRRDGRKQ